MNWEDALFAAAMIFLVIFAGTAIGMSIKRDATIEARSDICVASNGVLVEGTHCLILPNNNLIDLRGNRDG
jgi:hypothetical protein